MGVGFMVMDTHRFSARTNPKKPIRSVWDNATRLTQISMVVGVIGLSIACLIYTLHRFVTAIRNSNWNHKK